MKILEHITKRPVAVSMVFLVILTTGIVSFFYLPLELMPGTEYPELSVQTTWLQASPETVEAFVTSPIEGVCNTLAGMRTVSSMSQYGSSIVTVKFNRDTNMNFAALELNEKLSTIRQNLPYGVYSPQIIKYVPKEFSTGAFITYHICGNMPLSDLRFYALDKIRGPLMGVDGISSAEVQGGVDPVVEVELDPQACAAYGINTYLIHKALTEASDIQGLGILQQQGMRFSLRMNHKLETLYDIENVFIINNEKCQIKLQDIATVKMGSSIPQSLKRINAKPAVVINVYKEPGANSIHSADAVFAKMEVLKKSFPPGMNVFKVNDQSEQIRAELRDVTSRALYSLVVVFIILLLFLRQLSSPIIILSTIFFAVLMCINLFYACGVSLNMLTLAGLALGFGMLVDNSVVVLDNIFRCRQSGLSPQRASVEGTQQVIMPVMASTLTTIAALGPFLYMTGDTKIFYIPFVQAVVFSLAASVIVAFSFTPALTTQLLTYSSPRSVQQKERYITIYTKILKIFIKHKIIVLSILVLMAGLSGWAFVKYVERGEILGGAFREQLSVNINFPKGTELEFIDKTAYMFEQEALKDTLAEMVTCDIFEESAYIKILFPLEIEQSIYPYMLHDKLIAKAVSVGGAQISITGFGDGFSSGFSGKVTGYRIKVLGYNYKKVKEYAEMIGARLGRNARVDEINTNANQWYLDDSWEMMLEPNREKLDQSRISVVNALAQIQPHLRENTGQQTIVLNGKEEQLLIKNKGAAYFDVNALRDLHLQNQKRNPVRITDFMDIVQKPVLTRIDRENQQYYRHITFEFHGPGNQGDKLIDNIIKTTQLPPGYSLENDPPFGAISYEESKQIYIVIALSLLLVFMITAILFESLIRPFVVMLTVPLGLIGVFLTYLITDRNFDRGAYIGLVLLGGIVVNNSILLVAHIQHLEKSGLSKLDAVIQGAQHRIRPILMTSATTIFGLFPLIIHSSSETLWSSLAITTAGGLFSSTLLVLLITPLQYIIFINLDSV